MGSRFVIVIYMITPTQSAANTKWLREYAAENNFTHWELSPSMRNVPMNTIRSWIKGDRSPRKRTHLRSVAAFRLRIEGRIKV